MCFKDLCDSIKFSKLLIKCDCKSSRCNICNKSTLNRQLTIPRRQEHGVFYDPGNKCLIMYYHEVESTTIIGDITNSAQGIQQFLEQQNGSSLR